MSLGIDWLWSINFFVWVIEIEVNVKIAKYVDFIIVCIEFTKMGVYNF